jgi:hypothetical protein
MILCNKVFCLVLFVLVSQRTICQTFWTSKKYGYKVEIPKGFKVKQATGSNVDFKVGNNDGNSIVIVVKKIPIEYKSQSLYQVLGNLEDYANYWKQGANEIFNSPKLIKYGKTKINNYDAFWLDYTTDNDTYYYKNYSIKKGNLVFAITFFSTKADWNYYSAIWFRFKEQIKL